MCSPSVPYLGGTCLLRYWTQMQRGVGVAGFPVGGGGVIRAHKIGGGAWEKGLADKHHSSMEKAPLCLLFMSPHYGEPQEGKGDVATFDFVPSSGDPENTGVTQ